MEYVHQGEIIKLESSSITALVMSREFFNQSGFAIVCPIVKTASGDALHIPVKTKDFSGIALLEHMKSLDLQARHYKSIGVIDIPQIQNISDAAQDILNYYPF